MSWGNYLPTLSITDEGYLTMFRPNDRVVYEQGRSLISGTVIRVAIPFRRDTTALEPVEFFPASEPSALVRFDDGRESLVLFSDLQHDYVDQGLGI